ncbi:MAG TPA: hypothetical protein VN964_04965 [Gemmatimonadales bacterium]|nr:hypothetical protein [Gemmatimonadales bacterium]
MCAPVGGEGGFSLSFPEASELVILSAAGAKDLLSHRCEGPISGAAGAKDLLSHGCEGRFSGAAGAKDLLSHGCEGRFAGAAGADDLRCGVEEQQVLRSRACRALAQDDKRRVASGKEKMEDQGMGGSFPSSPL